MRPALQVEVDGLVEKLDEAHELLQASGYQIDNARTETRWSWLPLQSVHSSAPVVYAVSALPSDMHALMLHCYEGKTWLWLWPYGYDLHGGENYSVFAGFDDAPLIHQATEPYNPGPAVGLLDVKGGTFWHKDTFSVQGAYGGVTIFDTTQLKRMFPTEGALCSGIRPTAIKNKKCVLVGLNKYIIPLYISSQALPSYVFLTACWLRSTTPRRKILFGRLDLILQRSVRSFEHVSISVLCARRHLGEYSVCP